MKLFLFCSVPMQQQLRPSLPSQGLPAIPCALPAPCVTRAALVEHKDAQSPGQLDLHGDCPESVEHSPAPALPCAVGQPELFSSKPSHVCAGAARLRAAFCQGFLAHPAVLQLHCRGSLSRSLPAGGHSKWPGAPGALAAREEQPGVTHGSESARAGTTRLQVGQGSLVSHPPVPSLVPHSFQGQLWQRLLLCLFLVVMG